MSCTSHLFIAPADSQTTAITATYPSIMNVQWAANCSNFSISINGGNNAVGSGEIIKLVNSVNEDSGFQFNVTETEENVPYLFQESNVFYLAGPLGSRSQNFQVEGIAGSSAVVGPSATAGVGGDGGSGGNGGAGGDGGSEGAGGSESTVGTANTSPTTPIPPSQIPPTPITQPNHFPNTAQSIGLGAGTGLFLFLLLSLILTFFLWRKRISQKAKKVLAENDNIVVESHQSVVIDSFKSELPTPFNVPRSMEATFLAKFELPAASGEEGGELREMDLDE